MNAKEYQREAERTLIDGPGFDIPDNEMMVVWTAIGLAGEAGEVAELAKKGVLHRHGIDLDKFSKELGDCLWYIAALCSTLGLDMGEVMKANVDKLRVRYPNGFNSDDSKKRVDIGRRAND